MPMFLIPNYNPWRLPRLGMANNEWFARGSGTQPYSLTVACAAERFGPFIILRAMQPLRLGFRGNSYRYCLDLAKPESGMGICCGYFVPTVAVETGKRLEVMSLISVIHCADMT